MLVGYLFSFALAGSASAQSCGALPNTLTNGQPADASQVMANFNALLGCIQGRTFAAPTPAVFDSGTSATYTTPAGTLYLRVTITAGGGGGAGGGTSAGNGGTGGTTSFGSFTVVGGGGGQVAPSAGIGGTGGTGICNLGRSAGSVAGNTVAITPTPGGASIYGAGPAVGGGGAGGGGASNAGPGGGGGESCDMIITSPAATYTYTVGTGGAGGTTSNGGPGIAGSSGRVKIIAYAQ
jgi:hypothetical protein